MYIEKCKNNGTDYIRLVKSQRVLNSKGVKTVRKKIVKNIGPLKRFDDGKPDFMQRLKDSFKNGTPIIEGLEEFLEKDKRILEKYKIIINEGSEECIGHPKKYSNALIERILEELGLISFVDSYKRSTKYEFDLMGFLRLLIYGRILNPASKINTISQNSDYLFDIIKDPYEYNVYDTLDFVHKYKKVLLNKINSNLVKNFNRKTDFVYYDVTNFYFEIENPDADIENEDNSVSKGLRKLGVSKEERKLPIVQMGLFMDNNGLPISIEMFPGNTLDHQTVAPALKNSIDDLNMSRFIFVGDRGICNGEALVNLDNQGHGWVVSKSIAKSNEETKKWIFNQNDYTYQSENFKYKSKIETREVKNSKGEVIGKLTEKIVVYWSKSYQDKQMHENKSFLDFIDKFKANPSKFKLNKLNTNMLKKVLKDEAVNILTGEVVDTKKLVALIDETKLQRIKDEMGYYQIISSELQKDDLEIIDIYHGLSRIEDQFRVMKGTLNTRPIFLRNPDHINAHLTICMIALTVMRIIQNKIIDFKSKTITNSAKSNNSKRAKYWEFGLTGERLQNALNKWTVEELTDGYYRFNNIDDKDLKLILDAFDIKISNKLYRRQDLRTLKTSIKINM